MKSGKGSFSESKAAWLCDSSQREQEGQGRVFPGSLGVHTLQRLRTRAEEGAASAVDYLYRSKPGATCADVLSAGWGLHSQKALLGSSFI